MVEYRGRTPSTSPSWRPTRSARPRKPPPRPRRCPMQASSTGSGPGHEGVDGPRLEKRIARLEAKKINDPPPARRSSSGSPPRPRPPGLVLECTELARPSPPRPSRGPVLRRRFAGSASHPGLTAAGKTTSCGSGRSDRTHARHRRLERRVPWGTTPRRHEGISAGLSLVDHMTTAAPTI